MALRQAGTPKRADPNTIQDKVLVGYQGWFTCAGDGEPIGPGHHGWLHWFNSPIPSGGRPNVDLWPDTSDYDPSELYVAPGLTTSTGDPVHLFSSRNPKTVQRHFHWMALHGVDGAFLQRFAGQCEIKPGNLGVRNLRDEIGDRVREAAEAQGRVFAIMYDVSGVAPDKIQNILEQDWAHLLREKHILDSPNYLHEKNRPVVALWGFGLNGRNHTPELVRAVAGFFRSFTPGGVYLVAGIPGHWRTSTSDADRNPEFVQVWTECFDAISPWTVGRYGNEEEADQWGQGRLKADADYLNRLAADGGPKVDYIPVVLPGGSGFNLSEGKWRMNDMRRNGGRFLWRQLYNARRAGVRTIYGAMWDEYDEGTVYMPVVSYASQLPVHSSFRFLALDVDGHDLPSDWYMRILGYAAEAFHGERTLLDTFPVKELQDYWTTRPHHEDKGDDKQADVEAVTRAFKEWEVSQRHAGAITDTPPPYSLEDTPARHPSTRTIAGDGPTRPPPVRQDMRPSSAHPYSLLAGAGAVAAPLAVGFAAHALSAGSTPLSASSPPPVKMASRPPPPTAQPSYPIPLGPPPPVSGRPFSPPVPVRHPSHDISMHHPHAQGRVPSIGHGGMGFPAPPGAPPPMCFKDERRRGRSRSRSRSKSRSHSRSRKHKHKGKRSRSPLGHGPPMHPVHHSLHGHSSGPSYDSVGPHGHGHHQQHQQHQHHHAHSLSPVGSSHGMGFPSAGGGMYDAYPGGGGGYTPIHSHPVGHAYGQQGQEYAQGPGQGEHPYAQPHGQDEHPYAQPQGPYGSYAAPSQPQGGYGYGQGYGQQGYDAMGRPQQPGYGYTSYSSSSSGQYSSYGPGGGPSYPGGPPAGGGGPMKGGIASALRAVESVAGPQARNQVEKTVGTLLNKFK